ncbi:MAG: YfiR family protein [Terriglobia bacterium]
MAKSRSSGSKRAVASALLVAAALFGSTDLRLGAWAPAEYEVKAAYLYNFGRFVHWPVSAPAAAGNLFSICVLGADPFGRLLDTTIAGEMIDGKRVVARRISQTEDAKGCRIVFVSGSEESDLAQVLPALNAERALTVSDIPQFTDRGGMIDFITADRHVRFEVNLAAARREGLRLSSQLLKLAVKVIGTSQ